MLPKSNRVGIEPIGIANCSTILFRNSPTPETETSTGSPALSHRGGFERRQPRQAFRCSVLQAQVQAPRPHIMSRHGNIKFILPHAGGPLPTLAPRLGTIGTLPWVAHPAELTQAAVRTQLSRLCFDTAIAGTATSIGPVLELTKPDHVVFGSDFPPASEPVIDQNIAALGALTCMNEAEKSAINRNARRLFRRFAAEVAGD